MLKTGWGGRQGILGECQPLVQGTQAGKRAWGKLLGLVWDMLVWEEHSSPGEKKNVGCARGRPKEATRPNGRRE